MISRIAANCSGIAANGVNFLSLTFIDFFVNISGFTLEKQEASHKCDGYVEWDKFARKSYEAIHNTSGECTEHNIKP